jgi:hypothetical protein
MTVEENFKRSNAIFSGKIISVDTIKSFPEFYVNEKWSTPDSGVYYPSHLVTLKLNKSFKGENLSDTIYIMTGQGGGDCGYSFDLKKNYIIYAENKNYHIIDSVSRLDRSKYLSHPAKYLTTTVCDRTTDELQHEEKLLTDFIKNNK